jgi:hypothetical protein
MTGHTKPPFQGSDVLFGQGNEHTVSACGDEEHGATVE